MLWFVVGVLAWFMVIFTRDERTLVRSLWAGVFAVFFQIVIDYFAIKTNLYTLENTGLYKVFDIIPVVYTLGLVFPMGTLFAYHLPYRTGLKFMHIIIFSLAFWLVEGVMIQAKYLVYLNWTDSLSLVVNLLVFMSLAFLVDNLKLRGGNQRA